MKNFKRNNINIIYLLLNNNIIVSEMLQLQIELIGINICTTHVRVHLSHVD